MMKRLNKEGPAVLGAPPSAPRRSAQDLGAVLTAGHRVVDIRPAASYAASHIPGTINIPFNKSFVTWSGWFLPYDGDFYLVSDDATDATVRAALGELAMIGLDRCAGWFGADALATGRASIPQATPGEIAPLLASGQVTVVDVRAADEYAAGHLVGAVHIPLGRLEERLGELDLSRPLVMPHMGCLLLWLKGLIKDLKMR